MSYTYEITTAGKALIAKAQTGEIINFTKAKLGKGDLLPEELHADFTDLIDPEETEVNMFKHFEQGTGNAEITITYSNVGLVDGFYVKEIGLFADDPDVGEILFLYCYSSDADYLPPDSLDPIFVEQVVKLIITVDNATDVTTQIVPSTNIIRNNFSANSILKADIAGDPEALNIEEDRIVGRKAGGVVDALSPAEGKELLGLASVLAQENFDANSILKADVANTPGSMTVSEDTLVGRKSGGLIEALNPADTIDMLGLYTTLKAKEIYFNGPIVSSLIDFAINPPDLVREYNYSGTADGVGTFNSLSAGDDGKIFEICNDSFNKLSIKPPIGSEIGIWISGKGYGIESDVKGSRISLRYDNSIQKLSVISYSGQWSIEGLSSWIPMRELHIQSYNQIDSWYSIDEQVTKNKFYGGTSYRVILQGTYAVTSAISSWFYTGTDNGEKWSYYNKPLKNATVSGWLRLTNSDFAPICFADGSSNDFWFLYRSSSGKFYFDVVSNGTTYTSISSNAVFLDNLQWLFISFVYLNGSFGLYINGTQVAWLGASDWTQSGSGHNSSMVTFGRKNISSSFSYLSAELTNWVICEQNLYNANPNVGMTNVIDVPKNPSGDYIMMLK
ncbi:MAG: hypothetical protein GY714_04870 [Desulfobacterales bacterium]|nr:hypothetical protein [Desulfobacterales bacterium]